jgi:tRNA(Ile)-lysidine synthase
VLANLRDGHASTLDGCHLMPHGADIWVFREFRAVQDIIEPPDRAWDKRWRVMDPDALPDGAVIKALGDAGLAHCPDRRETGVPRAVLRSTPAVWRSDELIIAPFAQTGTNRTFALKNDAEDLFAALLSH